MKASKLLAIGILIVAIASFTIFYIVDNLHKALKRCEIDKTLKICRTNTLGVVVVILLIIVAGLVIVIATVAYILVSTSGEI